MIVVCPQCSKRYMLDNNLVPKQGRQVRCFSCQNVWHQGKELLQPSAHTISLKEIDVSLDPPLSADRSSGWISTLVLFAIIISSMSIVVFGREHVVKFWPNTERYYELAGLSIKSAGSGLSITNARSLMHQANSQDMIQVAGQITNTSDHVRSIPPLKVKLLNKSSDVLDSWEHQLSEYSLLPGEQIRFETEPHPKVSGTDHVFVKF